MSYKKRSILKIMRNTKIIKNVFRKKLHIKTNAVKKECSLKTKYKRISK